VAPPEPPVLPVSFGGDGEEKTPDGLADFQSNLHSQADCDRYEQTRGTIFMFGHCVPWWLLLILLLIPLCCCCCLFFWCCCGKKRKRQGKSIVNIELSGDAVPPPPPLSKELTLHRRVMLTATGGSSPHIRLRDAEDGPDDISSVSIHQTELKTETMTLHRGPSSHEEFLAETILDPSRTARWLRRTTESALARRTKSRRSAQGVLFRGGGCRGGYSGK
jgi:hypothetical protein